MPTKYHLRRGAHCSPSLFWLVNVAIFLATLSIILAAILARRTISDFINEHCYAFDAPMHNYMVCKDDKPKQHPERYKPVEEA